MALTANKISSGPIVTHKTTLCRSHEKHSSSMSTRINRIKPPGHGLEHGYMNQRCFLTGRSTFLNDRILIINGKSDRHTKDEKIDRIHSVRGLAEACKFVHNDAKYVNERARNDIVLLSRGIMRLDARARQDVAFLGTEFLKLDARAREDTEKIDRDVKEKAKRLNSIAAIIKDKARSRLKSAADEHWSDGALERAMEDALMALEFIVNIHDMMVSKMYKFPLRRDKRSLSANNRRGRIRLEKNGKSVNFLPGDVTTERIAALQEAYWIMASALSEADGIDYTDPEELELLVTTLIDLDAMDGKQSVSLLAECSSSPDDSTRRALANALAAAPSMWTLGNAGMGALQRLAEDSNPAIAAAASKAIYELKKQWEIEEGDSWRFMMDESIMEGKESTKSDSEEDTR
ncbi:senescence-associated protein AAF, chloroplastic isoform X14 [Arachis hypogaea]|uniref:senescence-associated protein AAF, chloroplastic isoform X14 n=1 Tax=Arachis hypogaea TaxID=3818 RepID=UPI003B215FEE